MADGKDVVIWIYILFNCVDLAGRFVFPPLGDLVRNKYNDSKWPRVSMYSAGVVMAGVGTFAVKFAGNIFDLGVCTIVVGIGTALFVANWNSLIKEFVGDRLFSLIYSHSLSWAGIVQFKGTLFILLMVYNQGGSQFKDGREFSDLLMSFGVFLIMAAFPMLVAILGKSDSKERLERAYQALVDQEEENKEGVNEDVEMVENRNDDITAAHINIIALNMGS